jgi:hypothetical protein
LSASALQAAESLSDVFPAKQNPAADSDKWDFARRAPIVERAPRDWQSSEHLGFINEIAFAGRLGMCSCLLHAAQQSTQMLRRGDGKNRERISVPWTKSRRYSSLGLSK